VYSRYLLAYDCVTFYRYLESLKLSEDAEKKIWLQSTASTQLFRVKIAAHTYTAIATVLISLVTSSIKTFLQFCFPDVSLYMSCENLFNGMFLMRGWIFS